MARRRLWNGLLLGLLVLGMFGAVEGSDYQFDPSGPTATIRCAPNVSAQRDTLPMFAFVAATSEVHGEIFAHVNGTPVDLPLLSVWSLPIERLGVFYFLEFDLSGLHLMPGDVLEVDFLVMNLDGPAAGEWFMTSVRVVVVGRSMQHHGGR